MTASGMLHKKPEEWTNGFHCSFINHDLERGQVCELS